MKRLKKAALVLLALLAVLVLALAIAWMTTPGRTKLADVYWEITLAARLTSPSSYVGPHLWAVAISPDGRQVGVGGMYQEPLIFDAESGERLPLPISHREWVMEVGWSADGRWFASTGFDGEVVVRDLLEGREVGSWRGRDVAYTFAFHPSRPLMAWGAYDGLIRLVDLTTGDIRDEIRANEGGVLFVTWTPDGERLVSTGEDGQVLFIAPSTGEVQASWQAHDAGITSISFSPDGRHAVTGGDDATVRLWDVATGALVREHSPHDGWVNFSTFLPDGRFLTVGTDHRVFVWSVDDAGPPMALAGHPGWLMCVRPFPDGRHFATSGKDGTVRIWDASNLEVVRTIDVFGQVDEGGFRLPAL